MSRKWKLPIISKETFDKFTEEEKKNVKKEYLKWQEEAETNPYFEGKISNMEDLFGKENIQPEPEIKTWDDIIGDEENEDFDAMSVIYFELEEFMMDRDFDDKIMGKILACYQIPKLIDLAYGGVITSDEWEQYSFHKYCVVLDTGGKVSIECRKGNTHELIAFRTLSLAQEFISYPENLDLVKQYYMI